MIYWLTRSIGSSIQYYWAHRRAPPVALRPDRIDVPTGVALFPIRSSAATCSATRDSRFVGMPVSSPNSADSACAKEAAPISIQCRW